MEKMTNNKAGYIYILTNPSFREDWVKVLVSEKPTLSKAELQSAKEYVPLPYEVFATIQFENYKVSHEALKELEWNITELLIFDEKYGFYNLYPNQVLECIYEIAYKKNLSLQVSVYENDMIHILSFNRGIQYLFSINEEEIEEEDEELDFGYSGGFSSVWTNRDLDEACDIAYEGHSAVELGLD